MEFLKLTRDLELTCGNYETELGAFNESWGAQQRKVRMEVVGYLGQDSSPIDGVYSGKFLSFVYFGISEKLLDEVLQTHGISHVR